MGRVYQGGVFIIPADVKPHGGGEWDEAAVILPEVRDNAIINYDHLVEDFEIFDRKFFPISKEGLNRLFMKSGNDGRVMLQVENLTDPKTVFIEWLPYNRGLIDLSKYDYFIMDNSFWDGENPPTVPNGIRESIGHIIVAAIGKQTDINGKDKHFAIINNAVCTLVNNPETGGGDPPGSGTQIPPGGN